MAEDYREAHGVRAPNGKSQGITLEMLDLRMDYFVRDIERVEELLKESKKERKDSHDDLSSRIAHLTDVAPTRHEFDGFKMAVTDALEGWNKAFDGYKTHVEKHYVSQDSFDAIKKVVYGAVALGLVALGSGLLKLLLEF